MPTNLVFIGGRTYTGGPDDYAYPCAAGPGASRCLFRRGARPTRRPTTCRSKKARTARSPVPKQVLALSPEDFFNRLNHLLVTNPPGPGPSEDDGALGDARHRAGSNVPDGRVHTGSAQGNQGRHHRRGQRDARDGARQGGQRLADRPRMGRYGTKYAYRAGWTFFGVGGNLPEDAVYPFAELDGDGKPFNGANKYTLHFTKAEIPPVNAFWSLTMYDDDAYLVANPINRYALGDRSHLAFDADGGLTLYIQGDSPGKDKDSNWLPAPKDAVFERRFGSTRRRRKSPMARGHRRR